VANALALADAPIVRSLQSTYAATIADTTLVFGVSKSPVLEPACLIGSNSNAFCGHSQDVVADDRGYAQ
jgi:hypothetical protein